MLSRFFMTSTHPCTRFCLQVTYFFNPVSLLLNFLMNGASNMLHFDTILLKHVVFVYLCACLHLGLLMSYLYDLSFSIISVFIMINYIISLKQTHIFSGHFLQKFNGRVLSSFCLNFWQKSA